MKLVSYTYENNDSIGLLNNDGTRIIDIYEVSDGKLPNDMMLFLKNFNSNRLELDKIISRKIKCNSIDLKTVKINAPLRKPNSFRDAYAFRKHVEAGRRSRGLEMLPEYDEFPVFYFSNHNSIQGPGNVTIQKEHLNKFDFELEVAIIICKKGKNIKSKDAYKYIAGLTIMNDWSARSLQFQEMKLNLGPAKSKDFATSIGPYLVTIDELEDHIINKKDGITFDLNMKGYINNNLTSNDNVKNMSWTFSEIIERASYGVTLYPGDLIGSGTCATGCLLELNQTNNTNKWLKVGDHVKLTVDVLGTLNSLIVLEK